MNYYKLLLILISGFVFTTSAFARNIPFSIDAAQFRYDTSRTLWEMYYSFPDSSLTYKQSGVDFEGELYVKAVIFSARDTVAAQEWVVTNRRDSISPKVFKNLVGQKSFLLKPGQYTVHIRIMDINDTLSQTTSSFPIIIRSLSYHQLSVSDMEIASSFENALPDVISPFKKGALVVIPNPDKEYIGTRPSLLAYSEIYNAMAGFKVHYTVLDGAKKEVFSIQKIQPAGANAVVETVTLPLEILPSGAYYIQLSVYAPVENPTDSIFTTKKIYVLNPDMPPEVTTSFTEDQLFLSSEFATMGEESIQSEFEKAQYRATQQEVAAYNSLSDFKAKQKFLFRFWATRDSDTSTIANETLDEFRRQITYSSTYFSNIQVKDGWRTDRGRVRLKYGAPSEVNRSDFNVGGKPYEIWTYNNMQGGGVTFCFVDLNGYNNHKLVHSTANGEVRDERWMERYVDANNFDPNGNFR
ncbi:MAG: GWxTD domain-containing protein [Bacteroidota bacterium]